MELQTDQIQVLNGLVDIGLARAREVLGVLFGLDVTLDQMPTGTLSLADVRTGMAPYSGQRIVAIQQGFKGQFQGIIMLVVTPECIATLTRLLLGDVIDPGDELLTGNNTEMLVEIANNVINGAMGAISNEFGTYLEYTLSSYVETTAEGLVAPYDVDGGIGFVIAGPCHFSTSNDAIFGEILIVFDDSSTRYLLQAAKERAESEAVWA